MTRSEWFELVKLCGLCAFVALPWGYAIASVVHEVRSRG